MVITVGSDEALLATSLISGALLLALAAWLPKIGRRIARSRQPPARPVQPRPFAGRVFVIDGDTLRIGRARVRLFGMDAPELTQRGGWKARSHMIGLAGGREVAVEPVDVDCYGRVVARVWLGSVDLSERMVRDGFARGLNAWTVDYASAEFEARRHRRGLWATVGIADPAAHRPWKSRTIERQ